MYNVANDDRRIKRLAVSNFVTKIDVRGKQTKVFLYSLEDWNRMNTKTSSLDTEAYFDPHTFTLHFCTQYLTITNIRHEVFHSWIYTGFPDVLGLSVDQLEELSCEIFAQFGELIIKQSNAILTKLIENKERKENEKNTKKKRHGSKPSNKPTAPHSGLTEGIN